MRICPLVLAGGRSRRMGRDKAQMQLADGQTLLVHAETLLRRMRAPAGAALLPPLISGDRPGGIADPVPDCGPLGGLHAAAEHLRRERIHCDVLLAIPVDMPLLRRAQLQTLCSEGLANRAGALCFERCYLPLWLRLDEPSRDYLRGAVAEREKPSVRALIEAVSGRQLPKPPGDWHKNVNTMREFADLTLP
ncbi:molybdenum cofactor guanylyltransferase [Microbulbifer halophilus]|uniref:Molybdenum cofactor guanylyltransferase n=1 Tax=Microbulbifer halophilus TaxID=453963 RepID=A0ABW5EAV1_9GAMM|nr:NTP transferase domain-containing protein [Microbulbifer halophilus]MCW8125816.1 NTP transferase domain-containing protein [Microbulbifer halophilus]